MINKKLQLLTYLSCVILFFISFCCFAQNTKNLSNNTYKKRVLENSELEIISSFYTQDGDNAAVTGGIGNEELTDLATNILISIPLNEDNILKIDGTISAYTSASSSNLDPFDKSGASTGNPIGSPWASSSGASKSDVWTKGTLHYDHYSNNRKTQIGVHTSFAAEYDYTSFGFGGSLTKLYNKKNTALNLSFNIYFDKLKPQYPTEIDSYLEANQNLNNGFFRNINIYDQNGAVINKENQNAWKIHQQTLVNNKNRNSYSLSLQLSQILSKKTNFSIFLDVIHQKGWLASPLQRVYFADIDNFYIGNPISISFYDSKDNKTVFQLADDIERLPSTRIKIPIGAKLNYYFNEYLIIKSYYRFYNDNWGVHAHTVEIELPVKILKKFTLYPNFRFYSQTRATYFAPYEKLISTSKYYTSDYDLSKFNSYQYGIGITYSDILTKTHIYKLGIKNIYLRFSSYKRTIDFKSNIVTTGIKFIIE